MKPKTKLLIWAASLAVCAAMTFSSSAQDAPLYRPVTLNLDAGTTGFGGGASWRFADHWGARFGVDYFSQTDSGVDIAHITYDAKLKLLSEPLTLDIYPWVTSSFHVSAGVMFNQNELTGTATGGGPIIIGGQEFAGGAVGTVSMKVGQQLVNPYLSIGGNFFYFDHAHHWAMGGELGVAYTGQASADLTRSGPVAPLVDQAMAKAQSELHDWANQYKWWPVAKLTVSYSF